MKHDEKQNHKYAFCLRRSFWLSGVWLVVFYESVPSSRHDMRETNRSARIDFGWFLESLVQ